MRASPFLINFVQEMIFEKQIDRSNLVVVAHHTSSMRRATAYAERFRVDIAVLHGSPEAETDVVDGRSSPPPIRAFDMVAGGDSFPMFTAHKAFHTPLNLVGNVTNKVAIMVDDIIDEVEHFITAAQFLKDLGATHVYIVATHALFSTEQADKLQNSIIDLIVVTNTIPHDALSEHYDKIRTIDISILLTEAIRRLHNQESLSYLFTDVSVED